MRDSNSKAQLFVGGAQYNEGRRPKTRHKECVLCLRLVAHGSGPESEFRNFQRCVLQCSCESNLSTFHSQSRNFVLDSEFDSMLLLTSVHKYL